MALIRYTKPTLTRKDMDAVLQTMVDEKIGPGEKRREFLKLFASYVGKKDGIALRNFYDVIRYSLSSLPLSQGDAVALSVLSPRVYELAIRDEGFKCYFTDTDDFGLPKADDVRNGLGEGVKALMIYEPLGAMARSAEEYRDLGIPLIEDVSESLGSVFGELKAGSIGDIVVSSFEEDGIISTAGGAIAVSDKAEMVDALKSRSEKIRRYSDLPDMNASLGIVQLMKMEQTIQRRNEIFKAYMQSLMKGEGRSFLSNNINFVANGYTFPVIIETRVDEALEFAKKYGIEARRNFTTSVGSRYLDKIDRYPNAIPALSRCISFPLYPFLKSTDVDNIEKVLRHIG